MSVHASRDVSPRDRTRRGGLALTSDERHLRIQATEGSTAIRLPVQSTETPEQAGLPRVHLAACECDISYGLADVGVPWKDVGGRQTRYVCCGTRRIRGRGGRTEGWMGWWIVDFAL